VARTTSTIDTARDRVVELGVYLPLGAFSRLRDEIGEIDGPKLRRTYRKLVRTGQLRVEPFEKRLRRETNKVSRKAQGVERTARTETRRTARKASAAANTVAPKLPRVAAPKSASELPIAGYKSLAASEVIAETRGLTQTELARVYKFEKANQDRTSILEALASRFVELPIPTYDALSADEITSRLEGRSESELETIRRYEAQTKARQTVLDKIDALVGK
jgi:hypothetical protein